MTIGAQVASLGTATGPVAASKAATSVAKLSGLRKKLASLQKAFK